MNPRNLKQTVAQIISLPEDSFLDTQDRDLIDGEIISHENLLHSLTQRIAALKNHRNSLSPTWRLPMEVLSDIMAIATHISIKENNESDEYPTSLPVPLVLGQVCAAWRTLAWKLPGLWSTIPLAIAKPRYEKQVELLDEWLSRAGSHQDLYIVLTLCNDHTELQFWRDYPPKEVLTRLYKRSKQWHTFYSTLPNLCFDMFASVHEKLPRLHTLILNRSGRLAYEPYLNGFPGGINNLHNGTFIVPPNMHFAVNAPAFGAPGFGMANIPLTGINLDDDNPRRKSPWYMLSVAPSLRTVVLPEALNPSEITLPWTYLTHLEIRTIPIDDCLRVLQHTPHIVSFDFQGINSGPLTFLPTPYLYLRDLRKINVFSDPANLSRFLESLTAPNLYSLEFKSTTGTLSLITSQLTQLIERSQCYLTKLGICIPSIGRSEEQIINCLMGDELRSLQEISLESWQANVEGLSDAFLRSMNPERRIRTVKTYSYDLDSPGLGCAIVAPGWVDVPTDEVREPVEQVVEVPEGEWVEPQEILLPNLVAMTYKGTLSFSPKTLKETLLARWRRKSRKRNVMMPLASPMHEAFEWKGGPGENMHETGDEKWGQGEHEAMAVGEGWFPTALLTAFEVSSLDMDFTQPIDEETNLAFREILREGFCLSIETRRGVLSF
ncbi:hypothetical protein P691DRAFT_759383 [Macrolepiota fuliginosa MF-IS2]|uniref:F-box domain-containing protein n=1 Tax=Macrolepiota fuliginosa MF-IS2 TaxID=1400762 RepID=A0A9P5XCV6_9AGAR|nr:hypothetical protein P691DRAFT_759383 [Macrolepiota fuliginosa MF-IS2]